MATTVGKVSKGMRFRSVVADCNALWEVVRNRGRGVWECVVVNEPIEVGDKTYPCEHAGRTDVFQTDDILSAIQRADMFERAGRSTDSFYDALTVGQIVHYENSGGQWVRCEVVRHEGQNKLKPVHLVGSWRKWDLANRLPNGEIRLGHHAKKILNPTEESLWMPSAGCVYESKMRGPDPRGLDALNLSVPDMTPDEAALAKLWQAVSAAKEVLDDGNYQGDPEAKLAEARDIIHAALPQDG